MKAIVNPTALLKELKKMSLVVKKNNIIPITGCALFSFSKDKLVVTGTDIETTYIVSLGCTCNEEFSMCIDYFDIVGILSTVSDPLEIERKDKEISIKSGKAKFKLSVLGEVNEFPATPIDEYFYSIDVDGDFFYHLSHANTTRNKDYLKPSINMAAIRFFKSHYDVVGCDGFMLYKKKFEVGNGKEFSVMVNDKFVSLCKMFQNTTLSFGDKFVKAEWNNETIVSRLSENKFANVDAIIKPDIVYNLTLSKAELRNSLNIISTATNAQSKQFSFNFKKDSIRLTSTDIDFNKESETSIDVENEVEIPSITLNAYQLLHLTTLIDSEEIELSITSNDKSVYMKPKGDDSILILIQPLVETK